MCASNLDNLCSERINLSTGVVEAALSASSSVGRMLSSLDL